MTIFLCILPGKLMTCYDADIANIGLTDIDIAYYSIDYIDSGYYSPNDINVANVDIADIRFIDICIIGF